MAPVFTERSRRVWAASKARTLGYGGIALVVRATRISRATIQRGLRELATDAPGRTRKPGGGRNARPHAAGRPGRLGRADSPGRSGLAA